jgi:exopolysaccharide biosynthesis protein
MACKDGIVHLITTKTGSAYKLPEFEDQMAALGYKHSEWLFMDGGSSTQCYFHNDGKSIYKRSYKRVPLLVGVKRE